MYRQHGVQDKLLMMFVEVLLRDCAPQLLMGLGPNKCVVNSYLILYQKLMLGRAQQILLLTSMIETLVSKILVKEACKLAQAKQEPLLNKEKPFFATKNTVT